MLGDVNKLFVFKSLLTMPSNVLPLHLKQTFPPMIWIFTEGEGDGIKSRLPFKIFSTLKIWTRYKSNLIPDCALTKIWRKLIFRQRATIHFCQLTSFFRQWLKFFSNCSYAATPPILLTIKGRWQALYYKVKRLRHPNSG